MNKAVKSIIVIDENEIDNWILGKLTESLVPSHNVKCFTSAIDALQHIKTNSITTSLKSQIIFLSIYMPIMDGYNFLRELEKLNLPEKPSVCVLSAFVSPDDMRKIEQFGEVEKVILKPITSDRLQEIVN